MVVSVEGIITSLEKKEKNEKVFTEIMLAQRGVQEQVRVRLEGDQTGQYDDFERTSFTGRLMTWASRNGVGMMVLV
ncbi:hypothetical protein M5X00_29395 [Paenibacillus alvei]|uniref:hypothetical protein n=1 Tax=Paenibacillus alvei TaxID=44250 RepID=UPI0022809206|nr:hypothetical protein [Paenibacillus alvei]MCY9708127.1 hypothetical protein [Paenibacillus alvei]MCY9738223.1 hypothetical protein [Paenibacillus alvei]MCY9758335.1 hypothetical protein [Paenibacillus alvei]